MIVADFEKRYLSDTDLGELQRNAEYQLWVKNGRRCPVCEGDGSGPGSYLFESQEYECPQDDYGHIAIQKCKLYWLHNIPFQYQILPPYDGDSEYRQAMRAKLDEYIEKFRGYAKVGVGLTFNSKLNGTGKTWAATYVLKELVKRGYDGWFAPFYQAASYYQIEDESERRFKRKKVRDSGVLVLDEVIRPISDAQRAFFAEELEALIRPRQDMNFPTIITTNLTMDEMEKFYPRVFSLLSAKNIEFDMTEETDARKGGSLFFRNLSVAENGEAWPLS